MISTDRASLIKKALRLEFATILWNVIEGSVAVAAGIAAGSVALVGFGLDSGIEVLAAAALVWRLKKRGPEELEAETRAERLALKLVSLTFFALSFYVGYEALQALARREAPRESPVGIGLAILAALIMPRLAWSKKRIAEELGSKALAAEAAESFVCAYLSVTLLLGLSLNALWRIWWADPAAGLVIVGFMLKEGREAWQESEGACCGGCD